MSQIPILIIILPLIIVPIILLLRNNLYSYILSIAVSLINLVLTILLLQYVLKSGNLYYELGSWSAPIGIRLNADLLACYFLLLINLMSFICLAAGKKIIDDTVQENNIFLFYIAWLLCNIGFCGIILTDDIFNLFVFLEISSLSSYFLISQGTHKASPIAAIQYLFIGSIGAVFILLAIGMLYVNTGTLNMTDISQSISTGNISLPIVLSIGLFFVGIGIKSALFPLHGWLVKTYSYAPSIVVTYFSGTSTKVGIYILLRVFLDIFHTIEPLEYYDLASFILFLSLLGVFLSTFFAIRQNEVNKMLAYSSIAQLSYILIAIMLMTPEGLSAALIHIFNHSIIKTGLFLTIAVLFVNQSNITISDLSGYGKKFPVLMLSFLILILSLIGLPLTSGFISKWYLVSSILDSNVWYISIMVLVTSFMTVFYAWLLIEKIYFSDLVDSKKYSHFEFRYSFVILLAIASIFLGIDTTLTVDLSEEISNQFYMVLDK